MPPSCACLTFSTGNLHVTHNHLTNALGEAASINYWVQIYSKSSALSYFFRQKYIMNILISSTPESTIVERVWGQDGYFIKDKKVILLRRLYEVTFKLKLK